MKLDLKLVFKAGIVWGIVGIVLTLGAMLLSRLLPIPELPGMALGTYAAMFGGVHFVARNEGKNILEDLIGGAVSGIVVAVLLVVAGIVLGMVIKTLSFDLSTSSIAGALLAGLMGAIGMVIIKRR